MKKITIILSPLIKWTQFHALLHIPLWICVFLALTLIFLPELFQRSAFIFLFFFYFALRYFWRNYLKKQERFGSINNSLFIFIVGGIIGTILLYHWMPPNTPELAVYTNEEKNNEDNGSQLTSKHGRKKTLLSRTAKSLREQIYATEVCQYAKQKKLLNDCTIKKAFQLDNNPETLEVLVLDGNPQHCDNENCHLWLIQMTEEQRVAFAAQRDKKPETTRPAIQANIIANWKKVLLPIKVGTISSSGWRQLQISHVDGTVEQWN